MPIKLKDLRSTAGEHRLEDWDHGFAIVRAPMQRRDAFNRFASRVLDGAGLEYVAFPVPDGRTGYDKVFILPMDPMN